MAFSNSPLRIALVDPTHTSQLIANDCFPLGIGFIAAYLKKRCGDSIDFRLYKYPEEALEDLMLYQPQVVLLANYTWNMDLSCLIGRRAKALNPSSLVVQGGPNFPLDREVQLRYLSERPELDFYIVGEGEFATADLIEDFLGGDSTIACLKKHGRLTSCAYMEEGELVVNKTRPRTADLDEIPSPYLAGYMDKFFDNKIHPLIETNRGCPFTCTFCQQGVSYFTKVRHFSVDRVKEELSYIANMIKTRSPMIRALTVADPNFGMFERDLAISAHIGSMQDESGWPSFIDATTGKNVPERVLKAIDLMRGGMTVSNAVQSMDTNVLKNIKRSNIKLSAYAEIQKEIKKKGMQSKADVILAMPGETLDSHLVGFKDLIDAGIQSLKTYQLMMLMGTELEINASRNQFGLQSAYRILPRSFGEYEKEKSFEIEEVCIATNTLSFEDYLNARRFHLVLNIFFNEWTFQEVLEYLQCQGISAFEWMKLLNNNLDSAPAEVRSLFDRFTKETKDELFTSEADARTFYSQPSNFRRLVEGELGNNLLFMYWAEGLLRYFDPVVTYAFEQLQMCVSSLKPHLDKTDGTELAELERFIRHRLVLGRALEQDFAPTKERFSYNFYLWAQEEFSKPLGDYRNGGIELRFALDQDNEKVIKDNLALWGDSTVGLTKMMSRALISDFKTHVETAGSYV